MELRLSGIFDDIREAVITQWYAEEKNCLRKGQDLLEIVTDKATFDIPSPCDGVLIRKLKSENAVISMHEAIAEIHEK
ncbi:MAG: lipoyl domain-containing protein [Candidatus Omnitrophota bacterium]